MAARQTRPQREPALTPPDWRRRGPMLLVAAGVLASALWGGLYVVLSRAGDGGSTFLGALLFLLPLARIWVAVFQAAALAAIRQTADGLRRDLSLARAATADGMATPTAPAPDDPSAERQASRAQAEVGRASGAPAAERPASGVPPSTPAAEGPASAPAPRAPAAQGPGATAASPADAITPADAPQVDGTQSGTRPPQDAADTPRPAPTFASVRHRHGAGAQGSLPLAGGSEPPPPLPQADLLRALHFPETPEDTDGFRALRRALSDPLAGQVIQAAQDVLTLLSKDGLYMDDLDARPPPPDLWRRFGEGERGRAMMAMAGIDDPGALGLCVGRMRADAVLRDAAHHFLHRFDRLLAETAPAMDDATLTALSETRSARAFMLLGQAARMFA